MADTDLFKRRLQYLEERSLRRDYFTQKVATSVTEESVKAAYDQARGPQPADRRSKTYPS